MADPGLSPEGFIAKTQTEIVDDMQANQRAVISPTWDPDPDSATGQTNGIVARQVAIVWEGLEEVYHSFDLDSAEGDALDNIGKLKGIPRLRLSSLRGNNQLRRDDWRDAETWRSLRRERDSARPALDADGSVHCAKRQLVRACLRQHCRRPNRRRWLARLRLSTRQSAAGATSTTLSTPQSGATTRATAPIAQCSRAPATTRASAASAQLLIQFFASRTLTLSSSMRTHRRTSTLKAGHPTRSKSSLTTATHRQAEPNAVAQAIWDKKPAGIQAYGEESGSATDYFGNAQVVGFSRVQDVALNISAGVETDGNYAGDDAVIQAILARQTGVGEDVMMSSIVAAVMSVEGVRNATVTANGESDRVIVTATEKAIFDSSTITLSVSVWQDF